MNNNAFSNVRLDIPDEVSPSIPNQNADLLSIEDQEKRRYAQDTGHRKLLVIWMICIVTFWLVMVLFFVSCNDLLNFNIQSEILIVLLATTTLNVLGLANIILHGLFPRPKNSIRGKRNTPK